MDERDDTLPELSLEEIMREFGSGEPIPEEPAPELPMEEPEERDSLETPEALPDLPAEEAPAEDTQRLEALSQLHQEAASPGEAEPEEAPEEPEEISDTLPEPAPEEPETASDEAEIAPEEAPEEPAVPQEEKPEAFSENWEPEYEQPMGEYVPPQPIPFRPRSRMAELKRQIIAGPEKRYYELTEVGVGKLQTAIFLSLLVTLLSAGATCLYAFGLVGENRLKLMVFLQFFSMLLSALLGSHRLIDGVTDLAHKRFTLNTMLVFTFLACCADGVLGLREQRLPCCAAFSLEMTMCLWSAYEKRIIERGQMDTLRKAVLLDSVVRREDYREGKPGFLRGEGRLEDFMDSYQAVSKPEKATDRYALLAFAASAALGIAAGVLHGVSFGVQVLAVSALAAVPATFFITLSRPMAVLEKRLHSVGTVLCGWQGVEGLCGKAFFPVDFEDLFPVGSIMMNGVKFYGKRPTDQVVAYATALIDEGDSGLAPLFDRVLESRSGRHYGVESFQDYGTGGIGGEVNGEPVLVGVLSFMKDMGVEIPEGIRVNQAVYVAVDGELCGLFALNYAKDSAASAGLTTLCAYRGLRSVLTSVDFALTEEFIGEKFGVKPQKMVFPPREEREALAAVGLPEDARALALTTRHGLASSAYAVTGARAVRTASKAGIIVHLVGGILGIAMMAVLAVLGRGDLLVPVNLFLYQLVWMLPGLLITEWTRTI